MHTVVGDVGLKQLRVVLLAVAAFLALPASAVDAPGAQCAHEPPQHPYECQSDDSQCDKSLCHNRTIYNFEHKFSDYFPNNPQHPTFFSRRPKTDDKRDFF